MEPNILESHLPQKVFRKAAVQLLTKYNDVLEKQGHSFVSVSDKGLSQPVPTFLTLHISPPYILPIQA